MNTDYACKQNCQLFLLSIFNLVKNSCFSRLVLRMISLFLALATWISCCIFGSLFSSKCQIKIKILSIPCLVSLKMIQAYLAEIFVYLSF